MLSVIVVFIDAGSYPRAGKSGQQRRDVGVGFLNGFKFRYGEAENLEVTSLKPC
jgi:hypothetical protein